MGFCVRVFFFVFVQSLISGRVSGGQVMIEGGDSISVLCLGSAGCDRGIQEDIRRKT